MHKTTETMIAKAKIGAKYSGMDRRVITFYKMRCRERGRTWRRFDRLKSSEAG